MDGVVVGNDDEDPSDSEAADAPLNSAYLSQFKSHLSDFQSHLLGIVKGQPLPPSYFPPTGYWTSAEKDSFFHLLCIHSRFRPDLIAAGLKSKTVADVCAYLELLEVAAAGTADDDEDEGAGQRLTRDAMDATMEMSEDWIEFEETQSQMIINLEPTWDLSTLQTSRSDELKAKQSEVRAKRGKGRTEEGERDRAGEKKRKREWMEWSNERKKKWAGEDAFRVLDVTALKVLGNILRKDEEARYLVEQDEERVEGLSTTQVQDQPGPSNLSQPTRDESQRHTTPPLPRPSSETQAPQSPSAQTQPQFRSRSPSPTLHPSDISALSPTSRRRYQKRLYMRRKRAQAAGRQVNTSVVRLKAGRRRKNDEGDPPPVKEEEYKLDLPGPETTSREGGDDSDDDTSGEGEEEGSSEEVALMDRQTKPKKRKKKVNKPGKTHREKIQASFAQLDIDPCIIRENGMGLFHLGNLGRLMSLYGSLHPPETPTPSTISSTTIAALEALVIYFVTETVQRAIVSREQEQELKAHTKVWRIGRDQIGVPNVEHALEMMGVGDGIRGKEGFFGGLVDRLGLSVDDEVEGEGEDEGSEDGDERRRDEGDHDPRGDDAEDEADPRSESSALTSSSHSLHRDIYTPILLLPISLSIPTPTNPLHPFIPSVLPTDQDSGSDDGELEEEEELDAKDAAFAEELEKVLWEEVRSTTRLIDPPMDREGSVGQQGEEDTDDG
ncbi:hypothetical protein JAAARDRAFT_68616 [Jaapia argillacea MUCL 33604]|uniref:Uncharacterized protein n=1 Tax=Jaapia argillacea MUCL 33604 TaxID=933084 RepID=A0A067PW49_9AGAM|nr:hypothetical protein JAAARDRAFT_68616 [Jaapia argillacea MUCL 33604]